MTRVTGASPAVEIRPYSPADADAVSALIIELQEFERQFERDRAPADREFAAWYLDRLLRTLDTSGGILLVACVTGIVRGFAAGTIEEEPELRNQYFYIAELAVAQRWRSRGIGTRLVLAMEDTARARGLTRIGIGVLAGSSRVHGLYARLGFRDYALSLRKDL